MSDISNISDISDNLMTPVENPTDMLYRILGLDNSNVQRNSWSNRVIESEIGNVNMDYRSFLSSLFQVPDDNINNILRQSFTDPGQNMYKRVLSEEGEKCIKYCLYSIGKFQNDACPMTLNNFVVGAEIAQLPCNHIFEKNAVLKWLKNENASCPVCRKPLDSKEVKKIIKCEDIPAVDNVRRNITPRNMIMDIMNRELLREEEKELQTAIMASLVESNSNNVEIDSVIDVD
jgi:hypothetical protein|tara:strand:+ start:3401 stop:4096 length:696 start_codon:yes stop_codon:yes gene_type:complete